MKDKIRLFCWSLTIAKTVALSACYTFMDTSPKGLQQMWLEWVRDSALGKNIYECKSGKVKEKPCGVFRSGTPPIIKKLSNGNLEEEYQFSALFGGCKYFYEYEPKTGVIVGFRFEESQKYGCRITGA